MAISHLRFRASIRSPHGGHSRGNRREATRLLGYATQAISDYLGSEYEGTAETVVSEAAIRLSGLPF